MPITYVVTPLHYTDWYTYIYIYLNIYTILLGSWDEMRMKLSGECRLDTDCPAQCQCDGTVVDCSGRSLKEIPRDIPLHTTEL